MSMQIRSHGGSCCGISHIRGFWDAPTERAVREFRTQVREASNAISEGEYSDENRCRLIEVVLVNGEYRWHPHLIEAGFVEVTSFVNSNSGNTCTVYHHVEFPLEPSDEDMVGRDLVRT